MKFLTKQAEEIGLEAKCIEVSGPILCMHYASKGAGQTLQGCGDPTRAGVWQSHTGRGVVIPRAQGRSDPPHAGAR